MISQVSENLKNGLNRLRSIKLGDVRSSKRNREIDALIQQVEWLRQANAVFMESEAQLHLMMDSVGECMTLLDPTLHIIWANKAGLDLFGSEMVGKKCYQVYHRKNEPCDPRLCPALRTFSDGRPHAHDTQVFDQRGNRIYLHCTFNVAIRDNSGRPAAAISAARDITERIKIEQILLKNKREWEKTFDSIGELVSIHDKDLCIINCNRAVLDLFNLSWSELIGKRCHDIFGCKDDFSGQCALEKTLRDGKSYSEEMVLRDLQKTHLVSIYPIQGDGNELEGVIRVATDISERKSLEAKVRNSQKMEAIGSMAGGSVHDFNNVLTAIYGFTELASGLVPAECKKCHEFLQKVMTACDHGKALVNQIHSFSRHNDEEPVQPILLSAILKECLELMGKASTNSVEVREVISCNSVKVLADPVHIRQVLINLYTNAAHAMPVKGGILEICLDRVQVDQQVTLPPSPPDLQPGAYGLLTIRDNGEGMDEQTMKRIFEPFFTTKAADKGTGMGLHVVQGIVKKYRGAIQVHSEKGKGTSFQIFLREFQDRQGGPAEEEARGSNQGHWKISPFANRQILERRLRP